MLRDPAARPEWVALVVSRAGNRLGSGSDLGDMKRNRILSVAIVATLSLGAVACGSDSSTDTAELTVSDARSRQPAAGTTLGAVYAVVSNPGDDDVQIESATASVTDTAELHDTEMTDGAMSMFEVEGGFTVPAGGEFVLEPGGPHVMLIDIDPATYPDEVEVTFTLSEGGPLTFTAPVEAIGDAMDDDSEMDGDMEMDEG